VSLGHHPRRRGHTSRFPQVGAPSPTRGLGCAEVTRQGRSSLPPVPGLVTPPPLRSPERPISISSLPERTGSSGRLEWVGKLRPATSPRTLLAKPIGYGDGQWPRLASSLGAQSKLECQACDFADCSIRAEVVAEHDDCHSRLGYHDEVGYVSDICSAVADRLAPRVVGQEPA